jgi:hypothetical protein
MDARALTENLAALLRREHDALAEFLVALADFDHRRLWVELGHASLFYYLHRELRLSKGAAQYRKVAAELIQAVPGVVEPLRQGQLCLSSVIEAAKVVTADNWETVLPRFYGLSRREAMEVVAELQPHPAPPERTVVTPVRPSRCSPEAQGVPRTSPCHVPPPPALERREAKPPELQAALAAGWPVNQPAPVSTPVAVARQFEVTPLTAEQSRLHLTVSREFMRKLQAAQDAFSAALPDATPAEILEAGLELLLAQTAKRKGLVEKPRKNIRPAKGDHIPAHVRREVWKRDGGRCQFPLASGGVCGATRHLELDHIRPRSLGGASTADNLRVACKAHNDLAARLVLGDHLMDRYTSGLRGPVRRPRPAGANDSAPPPRPPWRSGGRRDRTAAVPSP